jgi:cytosine deaminase
MYTTLSPCQMCSGSILLYGIPRVVIGENETYLSRGETFLKHEGVELVNAGKFLNRRPCAALAQQGSRGCERSRLRRNR